MLLAQEARFAGERGEQKKILAELLGRKQGRANKNCSERQEGCIERTPAPSLDHHTKAPGIQNRRYWNFDSLRVEYPELPSPLATTLGMMLWHENVQILGMNVKQNLGDLIAGASSKDLPLLISSHR